jgi:KUP system potassium uptake protein
VSVFTVLTTWQRGRAIVTARREEAEGPLREFVDDLRRHKPPVTRVPGTAVFLNRNTLTAPLAMRASVDHLHALNEHVVLLTIDTLDVSHVASADRIVVDDLGYRDDGITHARARFGYMDQPNVPAVMRDLQEADIEFTFDVDELSYFLSKIDLYRGDAPGMSRWRKNLFLATAHLTSDAADYFGLPRDRTVVMGSRIEV